MKTPSKHSSLEFLKALKADYFLSKSCGEYSEEETELLINQKLDSTTAPRRLSVPRMFIPSTNI